MKDNYITCNNIFDFKKYVKIGSEIILVGNLGMTVHGVYLCLDYSERIVNYIDDDNMQRADFLNSIKEIKVKVIDKERFKLGDIVEIANIDGLNRVIYNEYPKGFDEKLIGLKGKIIMIDKTTCKNVPHYLVDLPIKNPRISDGRFHVDGKTIFLKDNLKLVKEDDNKVNDSRFFNPSDIKTLNYKDLDGKTLKMTVVNNDECLLVVGVDKESNTIYMLHSEVK